MNYKLIMKYINEKRRYRWKERSAGSCSVQRAWHHVYKSHYSNGLSWLHDTRMVKYRQRNTQKRHVLFMSCNVCFYECIRTMRAYDNIAQWCFASEISLEENW